MVDDTRLLHDPQPFRCWSVLLTGVGVLRVSPYRLSFRIFWFVLFYTIYDDVIVLVSQLSCFSSFTNWYGPPDYVSTRFVDRKLYPDLLTYPKNGPLHVLFSVKSSFKTGLLSMNYLLLLFHKYWVWLHSPTYKFFLRHSVSLFVLVKS